jgi:hypothetical protein
MPDRPHACPGAAKPGKQPRASTLPSGLLGVLVIATSPCSMTCQPRAGQG